MTFIVAVLVALIVVGAIGFLLARPKPAEKLPPSEAPLPRVRSDSEADPPRAASTVAKAERSAPSAPSAPSGRAAVQVSDLHTSTPVAATDSAPNPATSAAAGSAQKDEPVPDSAEPHSPEVRIDATPQPSLAPSGRTDEPSPVLDAGRRDEPSPALPLRDEARASQADAREGWIALRRGLAATRGGFVARLAQIFGRRSQIDPSLLDEVQAVLLSADIGPRTTEQLLEALRTEISNNNLASEQDVWAVLRRRAAEIFGPSQGPVALTRKPTVILVVGVNGVGKTTTIGKLASRYHEAGKKVVLAAGDTFRPAAVLQLEVWGKRVGCEVVKGKDRADPAAVVYEAIKKALADSADVVIADTAGRLHTKTNLMEELKKVVRTAEKALERQVDEILLVLDATTGQNASQQAQLFREAIPVSGIVLTKLDGTAKGGVVLAIANDHGLPVRYVGVGERIEDLRPFDTASFVDALFERNDESNAAPNDPR